MSAWSESRITVLIGHITVLPADKDRLLACKRMRTRSQFAKISFSELPQIVVDTVGKFFTKNLRRSAPSMKAF